MARTRVLFLTRKWPPAIGGMEVYCRELVSELRKRADVDLRALPGRADGRPPSLPALARFGFATAWALLWRRTRADVVHGGDMTMWPLVWLAVRRSPGERPVLSAHGTDIALAHRSGLAAGLYCFYLRLGAFLLPSVTILANSRATARLCEASGFRSVRVVPLATHLRGHVLAAPEPYVLFTGRLMRQKGCAWFIDHVLPLLDPALTLVVAGVVWDETETRALRHPRVTFRGPVYGEELARLRAGATAVVVPNLVMGRNSFEGFGLSAVEGAADGAVVLASDVYGVSDAVRDGETGFLLPPGDAERWAEKIAEVAGWTAERREAFVDRARAVTGQVYSWPRVANETVEGYREGTAALRPLGRRR